MGNLSLPRKPSASSVSEDTRARLRGDQLASMAEKVVALAHEATQPLTAAANYLSAARHLIGGDPDAGAALDKAEAQILRAGRIIGRLQEFMARGEPEMVAQSLHELIHRARELSATALRRADVNLTLRLEAANDQVVVNHVEIEQAFVNLIRDAIGAVHGSPERTVSISTSLADGSIQTVITGARAGVSASIEAQTLDSPDHVRSDELATVRQIIEANRGRVSAAPYSVDGVIVRFALPLVEP
jgi:two-component system, LuxR family, sensor kinase FixL